MIDSHRAYIITELPALCSPLIMDTILHAQKVGILVISFIDDGVEYFMGSKIKKFIVSPEFKELVEMQSSYVSVNRNRRALYKRAEDIIHSSDGCIVDMDAAIAYVVKELEVLNVNDDDILSIDVSVKSKRK